jgi:coatomer subunit beta
MHSQIISNYVTFNYAGLAVKNMTNDDADRLYLCLQVLSDKSPVIVNIFNENCRYALSIMLAAKAEEEASTQKVRTLLLIHNVFSHDT